MRYNYTELHTHAHDSECLSNGWDLDMLCGLWEGHLPACIRYQHRGKWKGTWDLITHFLQLPMNLQLFWKKKFWKTPSLPGLPLTTGFTQAPLGSTVSPTTSLGFFHPRHGISFWTCSSALSCYFAKRQRKENNAWFGSPEKVTRI